MPLESPEYKLVDTNVLIVASAEHPESPFASHQTPLEDPALRRQVLDWLIDFEDSRYKLLLHPMIFAEYCKKLGDQDYGRQVIMLKMQTCQYVELTADENGDALIPDENLQKAIHDAADRKWVAASLKATEEGFASEIVNACDTDWLEWEEVLSESEVRVHQIIEEWCREKFMEKQANKSG